MENLNEPTLIERMKTYITYIQERCKEKEIQCSVESHPHNILKYNIYDDTIKGRNIIASIVIGSEMVDCELYGFVHDTTNNNYDYICRANPIDHFIIAKSNSDDEIYDEMCKFFTFLELKFTELETFQMLYKEFETKVKIKLNIL